MMVCVANEMPSFRRECVLNEVFFPSSSFQPPTRIKIHSLFNETNEQNNISKISLAIKLQLIRTLKQLVVLFFAIILCRDITLPYPLDI